MTGIKYLKSILCIIFVENSNLFKNLYIHEWKWSFQLPVGQPLLELLRGNCRYISYLQAVQFCSRIHAEQTETIVKLEAFLVHILVLCLYLCVQDWMEDDFVDAQCHHGRDLLTNKSFDTQGSQGILQRSFFESALSQS